MSKLIPRLADLSLNQKVGQIIMGGFPDPIADAATLAAVADGSLGNIIYFARNCPDPASVAALSQTLQAAAPIPLLIAADQEGGSVTRLTVGATVMPGAMALGATDDPNLAEQVAEVMADEMRAVGINVVLAPVADVNANPNNPVIGVRAFGEDPIQVSAFVQAMLRGFQRRGVAACVKHFPGHGDTAVDSHFDLPRIPHDLNHMAQVDLVPFRDAIEAGVALVMTTHIMFPALDPDRPSTLSRAILTDLLRGRLGFEGVVITDSMEMAGILRGRTTPEACLDAFAAGADIVCPSHDRAHQAEAYDLIRQAVQGGHVPVARLDQAVERILRLKRWLTADDGPPTTDDRPEPVDTELPSAVYGLRSAVHRPSSILGSAEHWAVAHAVAERAVTLVRDKTGWLPLPTGKTAVIEFGQPRFTPAEDTPVNGSVLAGALRPYRTVSALTLGVEPSPPDMAQAVSLADESDVVVLATRSASLYPGQAEAVRKVIALRKPTIVVALRTPYDLVAFPEASTFIAAYGDTPAPLRAVARVLVGDLSPHGVLPVSLPGLYPRGYGLRRHG